MEVGKQRAMLRKSAVVLKQQGGASVSAPKEGAKGMLKRKNGGKDDRPPKKGTGPFASDK